MVKVTSQYMTNLKVNNHQLKIGSNFIHVDIDTQLRILCVLEMSLLLIPLSCFSI